MDRDRGRNVSFPEFLIRIAALLNLSPPAPRPFPLPRAPSRGGVKRKTGAPNLLARKLFANERRKEKLRTVRESDRSLQTTRRFLNCTRARKRIFFMKMSFLREAVLRVPPLGDTTKRSGRIHEKLDRKLASTSIIHSMSRE